MAEEAFKAAGAADKLRIDVAAGVPHRVTPEQGRMAEEWIGKWLAP